MANKMKFQNQLHREQCWAKTNQEKFNKYESRFLIFKFKKQKLNKCNKSETQLKNL